MILELNDALRKIPLALAVAVEAIGHFANPKNLAKAMAGMGEGPVEFVTRRFGEMQKRGSAVGAAAGNASFSSFEEVGKKAQQQAFAVAMAGQGLTPEAKAQEQRDQQIGKTEVLIAVAKKIAENILAGAQRLAHGF